MKIYNCDVCGELAYFENTQCINCGSPLGYLPILDNISSLEPVGEGLWRALAPQAHGAQYKKCQNYEKENICNWMVPQADTNCYCLSCRLTSVIPNLTVYENRDYWFRLEIAKRRLIYSLLRLKLPLNNKYVDPQNGLSFFFLADEKGLAFNEDGKVIIGHLQGNITINVAEANDAIREKMRLDMRERYRTLLGHFRHEIGHYYWFLLIEKNPQQLAEFRTLFGDEQDNYEQALNRYYANGAPSDWQERYVSAYSSAHPWEDWAESWAHYLHMFDTLETARSWGLMVKFKQGNAVRSINLEQQLLSFDEMRDQWLYLSCALNSLNRSMGMKDVYPFVWSKPVINKIRFIQQVIVQSNR